jgi:phosphatidylserine/phosphatidylglycerophosphate/cardiolipin synthase-like enzyme
MRHRSCVVAFLAVVTGAAFVACAAPGSDDGSSSDDLYASGSHHTPPVPTTTPHPAAGTSDVRVIAEPGDGGAALVQAITAATRSVHVTMYLLTAPEVISALIARHQAGVDVQIVLNQRFDTGGNLNQGPFDQFQAAGVPVVWSSTTYEFTHEKCIVIDGATAWIMTMNSTKSSFTKNREYLAIDTTPADVAEAEAQFAADFAHQPYTPQGNLLMSPVTARPGIAALIDGATHTIDFEVEEMSDAALVQSFCNAANRHVTVRGALSHGTRSQLAQTAISSLKACGITMVELSHPYLHAKAIVVDGARVYIGSANYSATSLDKNRELGLVTESTQAVQLVSSTVSADIGAGTSL